LFATIVDRPPPRAVRWATYANALTGAHRLDEALAALRRDAEVRRDQGGAKIGASSYESSIGVVLWLLGR